MLWGRAALLLVIPIVALSVIGGRSFLSAQLLREVAFGNDARVEQLLRVGADPNARDMGLVPLGHRGEPALVRAAALGESRIVRALLLKGADVAALDVVGRSALSYAACEDRLETVRLLLDTGADANDSSSWIPALQGAVARDHERVVELLLRSGADPNRVFDNGMTPLGLAIKRGSLRSAEVLIKRGARVDLPDGEAPESAARSLGDALLRKYERRVEGPR